METKVSSVNKEVIIGHKSKKYLIVSRSDILAVIR